LNLLINAGNYEPDATFALESAFTCDGVTCVSEGTSFAVPQVVGVAALMMAVAPNLSATEVRDAIMSTAQARGHATGLGLPVCSTSVAQGECQCTLATCGVGRLDAAAAVQWAIDNAGGSAFTSADAYADYFKPSRLTSSSRGGGGGASDAGMLALLAVLVAWMLGSAVRRRREALSGTAAVTSGKR
jgi:serine protease